MCATACFDIGYKVSDYAMMKVIQRFLHPASMSTTDVWRGITYC